MRRHIILLLLTLASLSLKAQVQMPDGRYRVMATVVDGDTLPIVNLASVDVISTISPEAAANAKAYYKLRRDVMRTYPYAKLASVQLKFINDSIAKISNERERKKFVKVTEKQLKERFEAELKKMTVTQGRILIKLIDRETGSSSYSLVKELRGSFQAFLWQGIAKLFGSNLKSEYDPKGEDAMIESIVNQIERGELKVQTVKI